MVREIVRRSSSWAAVLSAGWVWLWASSAFGQDVALGANRWNYWSGAVTVTDCPHPPATSQPQPTAPPVPTEPSLPVERFGAIGGETVALVDRSAVGYIDPAVPRTQIRLRYDDALHDTRPDRAEFLYAKFGFFATPASLTIAGVPPDSHAKGPRGPDGNVNFQELSTYLEAALDPRLSVFVDLPVRFVNPIGLKRRAGFSDMSAGFKYAFLYQDNQIATFQFRTYVPTGDSALWLGNNHVTLEPGLLFFRGLTDRLSFEGEVKDWIPIDGSDFAGNIINYGAGLSYRLFDWARDTSAPSPSLSAGPCSTARNRSSSVRGACKFKTPAATPSSMPRWEGVSGSAPTTICTSAMAEHSPARSGIRTSFGWNTAWASKFTCLFIPSAGGDWIRDLPYRPVELTHIHICETFCDGCCP